MASAVAVEGVPLGGHIKELPAVAINGVPLAGLVKELSAAVVKGAPQAGLVKQLPVVVAPSMPGKSIASARRLLNTKGDDDDDTFEKLSGKDTADDRLALFSTDARDMFGESSRLLQLMGLMEDGGAAFGTGFSSPARGWWVSKDDGDAMQLKVVMPGLEKEHVKVSAEKNILEVKGEGNKDPEDCKAPVQYARRLQLPAEAFKMDQIKAEMNHGVLKVTVPKIKPEERKDVFQIKVE